MKCNAKLLEAYKFASNTTNELEQAICDALAKLQDDYGTPDDEATKIADKALGAFHDILAKAQIEMRSKGTKNDIFPKKSSKGKSSYVKNKFS